jgi:hypothetical protein
MQQKGWGSETFEQLWLLRACYRLRSGYDSDPTLTVAEAIRYGERLLEFARMGDIGLDTRARRAGRMI